MTRAKFRQVTPSNGTPVCRAILACLLLGFLPHGAAAPAEPAQLREATLRHFQAYVARVDQRHAASLQSGPFLWIDELPEAARSSDYSRLNHGEVLMRSIPGGEAAKPTEIPGGLIHDWQGIVFIRGAKLDEVLALLRDYDHHATIYAPDVERSRIDEHDGNHFRVFMRFRRHKVITVVLNTEQDIHYFRDSPTRAHSRSSAIRIREVTDPGTSEEREKPPAEDNGFLWQMETWWRMEERDGGVYVQNEAVSLTRDIPTGLGWLIGPFVTSIPKETLEFTLGATRAAVLGRGQH